MEIQFTTHFVRLPESQARTLPRTARTGDAAVAGDPYRGNDDGRWLQTFTQHVAIAQDLLNELAGWMQRLQAATSGGGSGEAAAAAANEIGTRWEMLWSQFDDARALALGHGRGISTYDNIRDAACDLSSGAVLVDIGEWRDAGSRARERTVKFRAPRLDLARNALAALRRVVPEARSAPDPEAPDIRPLAQRLPWGWMLLAALAAAVVIHYV